MAKGGQDLPQAGTAPVTRACGRPTQELLKLTRAYACPWRNSGRHVSPAIEGIIRTGGHVVFRATTAPATALMVAWGRP